MTDQTDTPLPQIHMNVQQRELIAGFSRDVVDTLHDRNLLSVHLKREQERQLEYTTFPTLFMDLIHQFQELSRAGNKEPTK